jgi:hypothetical protein
MSVEEGEGFVIRDRRGQGSGEAAAQSSRPSSPSPRRLSTEPDQPSGGGSHPSEAVTFSSFVFSLGTSALMLMGEQIDPQQTRLPVNLSQAKEIIDILSVLETKTRGNLTSQEQSVLDEMLYALRMKYVDLASGSHPTPAS